MKPKRPCHICECPAERLRGSVLYHEFVNREDLYQVAYLCKSCVLSNPYDTYYEEVCECTAAFFEAEGIKDFVFGDIPADLLCRHGDKE